MDTVHHTHPVQSLTHKLDAWLWRRGLHHPLLRYLVRGQIVFTGLILLVGASLSLWTLWLLWFGVGAAVIAQVFWGLVRHMAHLRLESYHSGLLIGVLLRFGARLLMTAVLLYIVLIVCHAPATAIVYGMTAAIAVAIATFALAVRAGHNL